MATNKTVFFLIGILLIVLGASMLAPYSIQVMYDENSHSFISSSFVTIFIGILFILANLEKEFKLNLRQTFLFSTLAWLMVAVFGSYVHALRRGTDMPALDEARSVRREQTVPRARRPPAQARHW